MPGILFLLLTACQPSASLTASAADPRYRLLMTIGPDASATPTPFQPLPPTVVIPKNNSISSSTPVPAFTPTRTRKPTRTATGTPTITFTPTITSTLPNWATTPQFNQEVVNIVLLGSDYRPGGGYRTDSITLLSINTKKGTLGAVTFPRDLYVNIPGRGWDRINVAMQYGGFWTLAETMSQNLGVRPEHYVLVNFNSFVALIDDMGGIPVQAASPLTDQCDLPRQNAYGYCTVEPGEVWMDGGTALWYVRSRHTSNDLDRTRRQQEVLSGIFRHLGTVEGLGKAPSLYKRYRESVETDLTLQNILSMAGVVPQLSQPGHMRGFTLGPNEVTDYIVPESGAWVLWPNLPAIQNIVWQAQNLP